MYVEVTGTEMRQDRNNNEYKNVQYKTMDTEERNVGGRKLLVKLPSKHSSFNAAKESYLDGNPEYGYDAKKGDILIVTTVTRNVVPYTIGEGEEAREVSTYTARFPGIENPTEAQIQRAFENAEMEMVEEDGVVQETTSNASNIPA